jgi:CRP-like cAMP-binding protein
MGVFALEPIQRIFEKLLLLMTKDNLIRFVQDILPVSPGKAEQLVEKYKEREFRKNDFVLKEGGICKVSHFIEAGMMRAYTHDLDGNDVTTAFYPSKGFATELFSFFNQVPSRENIQALTDCETWSISYEDMQVSFHAIPEFRAFGRINIINNYGLLKDRMLSMLHETAEQRYANLIQLNPEILQHAPLKYIASYLGITDTSLSRVRSAFVKK